MRKKLSAKGFSIVELLLAIIIIAALGFVAWLAWRHMHDRKKQPASNTANSQQSEPFTESDSSSAAATDPYAGWKSYCDATYHYCFKYPADWNLTVELLPQEPCEPGQVEVTSPDSKAYVSYQNDNNHDRATTEISVVSVDSFIAAGQKFAVVGGYTSYGTGYLPLYNLADSSLLSTYHVNAGETSPFPTTASFNDQGGHCSGSFVAQSLQQANTASDAKAWFNVADAQICLLILKSLVYQQ